MKPRYLVLTATLLAVVIASILVGCGGGSSKSSQTSSLATVTTSLSDPPTCKSPDGPYSHVYLTISDVQIHQSATANAGDAGWVDLTPDLKSAPKQVDLMALGGTGCLLAELGSKTQIQAGTYQQIRLFLAPNSTNVSGNQCGNTANCVVYNGQTMPVDLSSEVQSGIKIPSGQIAGGKFTVAPGEVKGLVIDFDGCASMVIMGNGKMRLKPVMHAGEVGLASNSITGQVVDAATQAPITGGRGIVALETKDENGVDRMIMQTTVDSNGNFIFCPVPVGTYEVVAVVLSVNGTQTAAYATTITTGVQPGNALGKIPMHAQTSPGTQQGQITGLITTAGASTGIAEDLSLSALQQLSIGGANVQVTIPLAQQQSTTTTVTTATGSACTANTFCANYTLAVPAAQPWIGSFLATGTNYTQAGGSAANYIVDAKAYQPGSSATLTCTPSEVMTSFLTDGTTAIAVTPGTTVTAKTLAFTGCQ